MPKTIREIKEWLQGQPSLSPAELNELVSDTRTGVQKLAQSYIREQVKKQKELARIESMWRFERDYRAKGYQTIAGVDEAGRGSLAGPVVAAAVILPVDFDATGLNDSKQLTVEERNQLKTQIEQKAISIGVGIVDVEVIDKHNILQATYRAMRLAIQQLTPPADLLLIDAVKIPDVIIHQHGIIKGDTLSHSIAAASIIAKTTRDEWMIQAASQYPQYGFDKHMGYGTPEHLAALAKWGPSRIHRHSFAPVRNITEARTLT